MGLCPVGTFREGPTFLVIDAPRRPPASAGDGRQALLFDLEAQRFYILGLVLHPQDLIFPAALLVLSALALFFFTAVAGRLWCGYPCPQTVHTEIFMWVERKFEGDRIARMRLDQPARQPLAAGAPDHGTRGTRAQTALGLLQSARDGRRLRRAAILAA